MSLRHRTLLSVGGLLAVLLAGLSFVSSRILHESFQALDAQRSTDELRLLLNLAGNDLGALRSSAIDWAYWDDTYGFAGGTEPEYVEENLEPASLAGVRWNLVALLDADGKLLIARAIDLETESIVPLSRELEDLLLRVGGFGPGAHDDDLRGGLILLPSGPMLLAAAPILDNARQGPCRGTLVVGRWFDPSTVAGPVSTAAMTLEAAPGDRRPAGRARDSLLASALSLGDAHDDRGAAAQESLLLMPVGGITAEARPDGRVRAEALVRDFFGEAGLVARAEVEARTVLAGQRAVRILVTTFLILGVACAATILLTLERGILRRITRLHRQLLDLSSRGDLRGRVEVGGNDEVAGVAAGFNQILCSLDGLVREMQDSRTVAEETARAKAHFLATMSHEIRNPMGAVLGMSSLLLDSALSPEQREQVEILHQSADALLRILDDVLDLSKIEQGKMRIEAIDYTIRDVVEEAGGLMAWPAARKGLELIVDVDPAVPALVRGDPIRVRQILTNLIGNAVKFTESGEIEIAARVEGGAGADRQIVFAVRDTGIGIAPERLERIFEEFIQADETTSRRFGGTGLGLAISRRLAGLMGGSLTAASVLGSGSTFRVVLPLQQADGADGGDPLEDAGCGLPVLLAMGSAAARQAVTSLLETCGCQVRSAAQAAEFRELLADPTVPVPPVILLDRRLPDADGVELASRINADGIVPPRTTWLLCRPGEAPREIGAGYGGIAGYIAKPVRRSRLVALLREVAAAQRAKSGDETAGEAVEVGGWMPPAEVGIELQTPQFTSGSGVPGGRSAATAAAAPNATPGSGVPAETAAAGSASVAGPTVAARVASGSVAPGRRVLVVDDNAVNRMVAGRMLAKLGVGHGEADGGFAAIDRYRDGGWDLVLMDIQMPGMDGYEATREIRRIEEETGRHIPVVALTAHALPEDRERCLAAGMDEYLTKPVRSSDLERVLQHFLAASDDTTTEDASAMTDGNDILPLQIERLNEVCGGDEDFERELLDEFVKNAPLLLAQVVEATASGDRAGGQRAAHTLRGSAASIGAGPLSQVARMLEEMFRAGELAQVEPSVTVARQRLAELERFLDDRYGRRAA